VRFDTGASAAMCSMVVALMPWASNNVVAAARMRSLPPRPRGLVITKVYAIVYNRHDGL
jgi:hypothetical protein